MFLFLSFNDDTVVECFCSEFWFKHGYLFYTRSDDVKSHKVLLSDLHYFSVSDEV